MLGKHCSGRDNNFALTNLYCKSLFFDIYKATNPTTMNEVIALLLVVYLMNFLTTNSVNNVYILTNECDTVVTEGELSNPNISTSTSGATFHLLTRETRP